MKVWKSSMYMVKVSDCWLKTKYISKNNSRFISFEFAIFAPYIIYPMKPRTLFIFAAFFALSSCKKEEKATYLKDADTATPATANSVEAAKSNAAGMLLPSPQNSASPAIPGQMTPGQPMAAGQKTAPGMNPAHGQPGHRCDIAVGAPLNSPAKGASSAPQQITVDPSSVKKDPAAYNVPEKVKTAPGMNPPHGEPGHRCDISVGAPLNSPAKSTTSAPAPVKTQNASVVPDPAAYNVQNRPAASTASTAGLNPAHGQPGHRCDLAVGAPLK